MIQKKNRESRRKARDNSRWVKRVEKRVQAQNWVKGAVNYDEDLHFSTYYLRASCSEFAEPLYPGYSLLVASYEGYTETYYLLKEECRESAKAIVSRALRQPRWLNNILREICRRSDALERIFPPDTSHASIARLSDAALLSLYQKHDEYNRKLYKYARVPEALDRGVSYFTEYLLTHLRERGVGASECAEVFAVLSEPSVPSVLAREIMDFDGIVQYARLRLKGAAQPVEGAGRARMLLDPELMRRLEAHRKNWQFLPYHGYGSRELATLDHYINRLLEQVRNPSALADCAELAARCKRAEIARREMLQRLKMDRAHANLFEIYPEIGAAKLYRRYAQLRNFYYLDMLLAEISVRLGVSEWTVRCMLPEEVITSLRAGKLAVPAVQGRLNGSVYVWMEGRETVLTGRDAVGVRKLFRPPVRVKEDGNILHGVIACRGKAAGPCKVIIRADDCAGDFAKGSIVASESTDPDLVKFLRAAGAVLTEQGGVTSHAAIICRELGIPTIIGIEGLLDRVKDGDWLEVDAEQGTIRVRAQENEANHVKNSGARAIRPEVVGTKAYNLGLVRSLGYRVPDFVLLDHKEVRRAASRPESQFSRGLIQRTLSELGVTNGDKLAVRSSAISEDREDGSAAGKYRSLLHIPRGQLASALRDFVRSNKMGKDGAAYEGAVIVQRMVEADCGGVCLTRDSRAASRQAVILEMQAGGNEGVTGGTMRPDRFVVDRWTGDILEEERHGVALRRRPIDVTGLVQQFLKLEAQFGEPLDIEWALSAGKLYILQARPIVNDTAGPSRAPVAAKIKKPNTFPVGSSLRR